jgi:hypothetical protein
MPIMRQAFDSLRAREREMRQRDTLVSLDSALLTSAACWLAATRHLRAS